MGLVWKVIKSFAAKERSARIRNIQNTISCIRLRLEKCIGAFTIRAFAHTVLEAFKAYAMSDYGWDQEAVENIEWD